MDRNRERLKAMDAHGHRHGGAVDQSVLVPQGARHRRSRSAKIHNEKLAELCARKPDRLRRLRLAAHAGARSRRAATRATRCKKLGAERRGHRRQRGWATTSPIRSSTRCWPRPRNSAPCCSSIRRARRELAKRASRAMAGSANTIGNPLDTTIALQKLIFEGALDRVPRPEGAGARMAAAICRSYAPRVRPRLLRLAAELQSEHQAEEEADANTSTSSISTRWCSRPKALRHLVGRRSAPARSMLGTDHPIPWEEHPVDHVMGHRRSQRQGQGRRSWAATPRSCSGSRRTAWVEAGGSTERDGACRSDRGLVAVVPVRRRGAIHPHEKVPVGARPRLGGRTDRAWWSA